jgi:hypothetical protein
MLLYVHWIYGRATRPVPKPTAKVLRVAGGYLLIGYRAYKESRVYYLASPHLDPWRVSLPGIDDTGLLGDHREVADCATLREAMAAAARWARAGAHAEPDGVNAWRASTSALP